MATTRELKDATDQASTTAYGVAKLASSGGTTAGTVVQATDSRLTDSRAPTGAAGGVLSGTYPNPGFAADMATQAELDAAVATLQPLDGDLTTIAGLTPTTDSFIQAKSSAWAARTVAQVIADLIANGAFTEGVQDIIGAMVAAAGGSYNDGANTITLPTGGTITVEEVDGSPTDAAVTKIVFPNGTLAIASHVATYTPSGGGGGGGGGVGDALYLYATQI